MASAETLNRKDVLGMDIDFRADWYGSLNYRHREMELVAARLSHILHPANETRIAALIGPTGIGKTVLANAMLLPQLRRAWQNYLQPSDVPVVYLNAPANGERSLSWQTLYRRLLASGAEPFIDDKIATRREDGHVRVLRGKSTVAALRESVESMIRHRNVRLIIVDEAVHLLRFPGYAATMDTLKSLADVGNAKLLLIGSYNLTELVTDYAQIVRRSEIVHYPRYRAEIAADRKEFANIVHRMQQDWPCRAVPQFTGITDVLMQNTLGSIGLLKSMLQNALLSQLRGNGEHWDSKYLSGSAKSHDALRAIEEETLAGEEALANLAFGRNAFSDPGYLADITKRMGPAHVG